MTEASQAAPREQGDVARGRVEGLLVLAALVLALAPIWIRTHFLTGDGPVHLYNASVLPDLLREDGRDFFLTYYSINARPDPGWLGHTVLGFLAWLLPGPLAEKVLLSGYVIGFSLGLASCVRRVHPRSGFLVAVGLLFTHHYVLYMGFTYYSLALMVALWVGAEVLAAEAPPRRCLLLALLLVVAYALQPMGLLLGLLLVGCGALARVAASSVRDRTISTLAVTIRAPLRHGLACLPALSLAALYMATHETPLAPAAPFESLLRGLVRLDALTVLSESERPFALAVVVLVAGMVACGVVRYAVRRMRPSPADAFLLAAILVGALYLLPVASVGAGAIPPRLQFVPYLLAVLWLARFEHPRWASVLVAGTAVALAAAFLVVRIPAYRAADEALAEYLSVTDRIESESVVLPLSFENHGCTADGAPLVPGIWLFQHAAGYLGAERRLVLLDNYEAHTGYFPLRWRPGVDPYLRLGPFAAHELQPPQVDLAGYEAGTGVEIDYVVLWCRASAPWHPAVRHLMRQLRSDYELVYTSAAGRVRLYRHRRLDESLRER